jgi:hypothetical protein
MEILKFSAQAFYLIGRGGAFLETLFKHEPQESLAENRKITVLGGLEKIRAHCQAIGLTLSLKSADRLIENVRANKPAKELAQDWRELSGRIRDEIADNLFLFIPKSHVAYYQAEQLFGLSVEEAFPSISPEISEAGKCLALHRNTACVCHLMRVLESGLRALAKQLKVAFDNKPWNSVIEVAEKRLKTVREGKRKPKNWKQDERFYSEAIAHFRFIKDAWRNYSMHLYQRYDEEQAESVFNHTKAFMRHLASKLKES